MRITRVEAWTVELRLSEPYTIAYETVSAAVNTFIRVETDSGITGVGCAAPDPAVTGERVMDVPRAIQERAAPAMHGEDPLRWTFLLERLKSLLPGHPSARAGLDMALFDIAAKRAGIPLFKLLGGYRDDGFPTSITLGILSEQDTVARALEFVSRGFRALKLKGGADVESDIARARKVREAVGEDVELRFDANQGYSFEESLRFMEGVKPTRIAIFEQPTARDSPDLLGRVCRNVSVPVMADESLLTLRDAFRMTSQGLADMVNLKLMKVGGIGEAIQINAVARAAGVDVMVGCMDEAALGIAAGLHFAMARPNVTHVDLDGHLDIVNDPTAGAVILREGTLYPTGEPGLGFDF